jgi:hypothetical protein
MPQPRRNRVAQTSCLSKSAAFVTEMTKLPQSLQKRETLRYLYGTKGMWAFVILAVITFIIPGGRRISGR